MIEYQTIVTCDDCGRQHVYNKFMDVFDLINEGYMINGTINDKHDPNKMEIAAYCWECATPIEV